MEQKWEFRYWLRRRPGGELVELTAEEAEKILVKNVAEAKGDPTDRMWELARFYSSAKQHEKALGWLRQIIDRLPDPERKAACVLAMGQTMEQVQDYEAAIRYYREALSLEPVRTPTWYYTRQARDTAARPLRLILTAQTPTKTWASRSTARAAFGRLLNVLSLPRV